MTQRSSKHMYVHQCISCMNKNILEKSKIFYKNIILLNVFYWYCFRFIVLYCFILFYCFNVFFFGFLIFSFVVVYRGVPVRAPTGLLRFNQNKTMVDSWIVSSKNSASPPFASFILTRKFLSKDCLFETLWIWIVGTEKVYSTLYIHRDSMTLCGCVQACYR